jgi:hypothetical protein
MHIIEHTLFFGGGGEVKYSEFYSSNFERLQILPVGIKSFAGSFATLANMLTSFGVTMTANLLLSWSAGGPYFCLPLA